MFPSTVTFDLGDPEFQRDPYPSYRRFRDEPGLVRGGPGQWVASRHADVVALLRDPRLGREFPARYQEMSVGPGPAAEYLQRIIIDRDPPDHTRLRRLMTQAMSRAGARDASGPVRRIVDDLLARPLDEGRLDAHADLAVPLPVQVMSELLGIPRADRARIERWSVALAKAFAVFIPEPDRVAANEAVTRLRRYFEDLIADRRARPGTDLLSAMVQASSGDAALSAEEIVDNALFVYYAGFETTTNLLATGFAALARHPDQFARLRADPALMPGAVEEFVRFDAPIHTTTRIVRDPVTVGNQTIRRGRVVVLALAAANHDDTVFRHPDRLDVGRHPNPHVGFGGGVHHCLGAALARTEALAAFGRFTERVAELELEGEPRWRPSGGGFRYPYCAYEVVPLRIGAA